VPLDPVRQYTAESVDEPTMLRVYEGADGAFTVYDDDGASLAYLAGEGAWIHMAWNNAERRLTLEPGGPADAKPWSGEPRRFRVELVTGKAPGVTGDATREIEYRGERVQVQMP
jgi:hypothetical protein